MLPRPASRVPLLCAWAARIGNGACRCPGPWGGPISTGFGTVYGAKPLSPRGKSVPVRSGAPVATSGLVAGTRRGSTAASAPSSWMRGVHPARRVGLDRAGRVGEPHAVMPSSCGHPQHAQHVRPVRNEDARRPGRGRAGACRREWIDCPRRPARVLDEDRRRAALPGRSRRPGRWPPRSSGRRRPCRRSRRGSARRPRDRATTAWSSRAAKIGDGRPSYWAAPMTTMASAGRCSSRWPCAQIR